MALFKEEINSIEKRTQNLNSLAEKSNDCISIITNTISALETTNAEIETEKSELTEEISNLNEILLKLVATQNENERLAGKFKDFLA